MHEDVLHQQLTDAQTDLEALHASLETTSRDNPADLAALAGEYWRQHSQVIRTTLQIVGYQIRDEIIAQLRARRDALSVHLRAREQRRGTPGATTTVTRQPPLQQSPDRPRQNHP